jgi:hypothetical protein
VDPKMIFAKKSEACLIAANIKCKPTLVPVKSTRACANSKCTSEGFCNETTADMHILGGLLFMWDVVPSFRFRVSVAASQKNPVSTLRKWKKHFSWDETKCMLQMMIWMSYFDFSHFFDQFRYIVYRIPIYGFVNMDYLILNVKKKIN